jgi:predicted RNase H-like HicB family nuclease
LQLSIKFHDDHNYAQLFQDASQVTSFHFYCVFVGDTVEKEDTLYVAQCPEVGTVSQGEAIEEAIKNLQEATELYLEEFPMKQVARPFMTTFEVPAHA